ncbi:unnamed protein product [Peniophora sp. CBMAI 1063]|nr:unnamed protein product [Peniophora sp. CBMAI 1063]
MPPSEHTPLLQNGEQRAKSFVHRVVDVCKAEGEPGWGHSLRYFFFTSWLNVVLVFVPLSALAHFLHWDVALRFSFSFIAIIPLAKLLGDATEQMSLSLGQTLAGLLNATFGNAVEIIVGITALLQDQIRIVQTSMLGSILSNLLLVLGMSFLAGGLVKKESSFRVTAAQTNASLMTLACITLVIPAAYHSARGLGTIPSFSTPSPVIPKTPVEPDVISATKFVADNGAVVDIDEEGQRGLLIISRGTALLLLGVYVAYLVFQLKTHFALFQAKSKAKVLQSEALSDDEEALLSPPLTATIPAVSRANAGAPSEIRQQEEEEEEEKAEMSVICASVMLLVVTIITSFVADYLVASIEEFAERYHIPKPFIGLILLPIVANAAEHVTSVWMAMKDKMELTIGVCVGSSIQLATFVIPFLVVVGWISGHELTLFFDNFETVSFFVSVLLVNLLIQDGKSNYMEGVMLMTLYLVIALAFWVS